VSSETLIRLTPQFFSSLAYFRVASRWSSASARPAHRSQGGATATKQRHDPAPHQRLAAVSRTSHPLLTKAEQSRSSSSSVSRSPWQERHMLRHAIDAAEVAPVRHRHAQIGDGAANGSTSGAKTAGGRSTSAMGRQSSSSSSAARIVTGRQPGVQFVVLLYIGRHWRFWRSKWPPRPTPGPNPGLGHRIAARQGPPVSDRELRRWRELRV